MTTPVDNAQTTITQKLDTSGLFNTVTNAETHDIVNAMTGLQGRDADQLVDRLQQSGQLDKVAHEVMDGDWFGNGGLSGDERRAFFADMAGKLDGQSLAALSDSFAKADNGGFEPVKELGDAVAAHAGPQAKVDYISAMKGNVDAKSSHDDGALMVRDVHFQDGEATAVGTVLSSLKGSYAEAGFRAIGDKLPDVLSSAIDGHMTTTTSFGGASNTMTWNADGFEAIMNAAASTGDPALKAQVFDAGAHTLREVSSTNSVFGGLTVMGKDDALRTMTDGLTRVIDSDTSGVMRSLTYSQPTSDGSSFAAYAKEMLNQNREAELGKQMGRLQAGNNGTENPIDRLNAVEKVPGTAVTPPQDRLSNAGALGYFVGGVYAATKAVSDDVKAERDTTSAILKSALTVIDKGASLGGAPGRAVAAGAAVTKEWVQAAVNAAIKDPGPDAAIWLAKAALPYDSQTRELAVGDKVMSAFQDQWGYVRDTAKP